jgi:hypothetical protein
MTSQISPSRAHTVDEFLSRLDAEEDQARADHVERQQRHAESLCRRVRQAFVDLGLDDLADWAEPADGAVRFGDLGPRNVERFVEMLERIAAKGRRGW